MEIDRRYLESLDYLYSFVGNSRTHGDAAANNQFTLNKIRELLKKLGDPHTKYAVIHIAGTKGKGSTAAMTASILHAGGYRVGLYTSPHLQDFRERIQVNGVPVQMEEFVDLVDKIKPLIRENESLSTFEIATALGLLCFSQKRINIAVIEVGLGGRLDATNVVDPLVSVITSISYDHMAVLGHTLGQIASEKAGIIKPGKPVVVAPQKEEALAVIRDYARLAGSPMTMVGLDVCFQAGAHSLDGQAFSVWPNFSQPSGKQSTLDGQDEIMDRLQLNTPLLGSHQVENAATAFSTIRVMRQQGLQVSDAAIQKGLADVFWPCRFEVLRKSPPVILDAAHNRDSARRLKQAIEDYFPGIPFILLFGASEDKDIVGILEELIPGPTRMIATQTIHPRAISPDKLVELSHQLGCPAEAVTPVDAALHKAMEMAGEHSVVVATGSVFLAAAARECWRNAGNPVRDYQDRSVR
jgi:dihydrofolate synthase / folylpolyglutamate synthase